MEHQAAPVPQRDGDAIGSVFAFHIKKETEAKQENDVNWRSRTKTNRTTTTAAEPAGAPSLALNPKMQLEPEETKRLDAG